LQRVDLALQVLKAGAADSDLGGLYQCALVFVHKRQARKTVQITQGTLFIRPLRGVNGFGLQGFGDDGFLEFFQRGVDVVMMRGMKRDGFFLRVRCAELVGSFQQTDLVQAAVRFDAIKKRRVFGCE